MDGMVWRALIELISNHQFFQFSTLWDLIFTFLFFLFVFFFFFLFWFLICLIPVFLLLIGWLLVWWLRPQLYISVCGCVLGSIFLDDVFSHTKNKTFTSVIRPTCSRHMRAAVYSSWFPPWSMAHMDKHPPLRYYIIPIHSSIPPLLLASGGNFWNACLACRDPSPLLDASCPACKHSGSHGGWTYSHQRRTGGPQRAGQMGQTSLAHGTHRRRCCQTRRIQVCFISIWRIFTGFYIVFDFDRLITSKEHSRAWYRIGATRIFSGSKKIQPQLSIKLREVKENFTFEM